MPDTTKHLCLFSLKAKFILFVCTKTKYHMKKLQYRMMPIVLSVCVNWGQCRETAENWKLAL